MAEESLEVKLSDNMDRWKSRGGTNQRRERKKKEDQRRERVRSKLFCVPEARKVGSLAKAGGAEPSGQMRNEKLHAIVARSTFSSQNV